MSVVKLFPDGTFLEYDWGSFDEWCVYLTRPSEGRKPLRDTDYFRVMEVMAVKYGKDRIYADYVSVYDMSGKQVEDAVLEHITRLASRYEPEDILRMDILYTTLYMTMVAEENKANAPLGRRIKRLGIHILLHEGSGVEYAAHFMRGKKWRDLDQLCSARGF